MWPKSFSFVPALADDHAVILGEDRCRIELGKATIVTEGRIVYRPHRFPSIEIELANLDDRLDEERVTVHLERSGFVLRDGTLSAVPLTGNRYTREYRYRVRQTDPMTMQVLGDPVSVECILYNFDLFATEGRPSNGLETITLDLPNGWQVTIGPLAPELRTNGELYRLLGTPWRQPTNALKLSREGAETGDGDLDATLFLLRNFLSFARGQTIGIGLIQGFSTTGDLIYAMPGLMPPDAQIYPAEMQPHWFSPSRAEILAEILPGFWRKMVDPKWKDGVEWAIYWWLSANHPIQRSETAILASQAGLEALVTTLLESDGDRANQGVEQWSAAKKIRRMISILKIPQSVPEQLKELRVFAAAKGWDGPDAVTKVRNALVHPSKGDEAGLAYEASQLGMWYLELLLLYLFEYKGKIFNRTIFTGWWFEQEQVPWA